MNKNDQKKRTILVVEYDVTDLTPGQVDCLTGQVEAQAEATDPYDDESEGHPDVSVTTRVEARP